MQMEQEILAILNKHTSILENNTTQIEKLIGVVGQHDGMLEQHTKILEKHTETLNKHSEILEQHTKTLNKHSEILEQHTKTLNKHSEILDRHTEQLESLQRSALTIEDYVKNRIPALFDGYSMHQEKQYKSDSAIEKLDKITTIHSLKISILEDTMQEHSNRLNKLTS